MKVVINSCFGGFWLSTEWINYYLWLKWINPHRYRQDSFKEPSRKIESKEATIWDNVYTEDNGEEFIGDGNWFFCSYKIDRTDPLLIKTVEDLWVKANRKCASLKIVEIPDWTDYEINEYDWNEHIAEVHRTRS